ncbi:MAG: hypothetical protein K9K79_02820 [Desulfohalobiaceae bacterium]|nr:hypothetical protein [Desulfohalobiaceae bacterium]
MPELNAYGTYSPYTGYAAYRLAHRHRTCLNRLPYGWNGLPRFSPEWNGQRFAWEEWDAHVGPLLDGSAFSDLPRAGEPVDVMCLPFSENWPLNLDAHYSPSYWADQAFSQEYQLEMKRAYERFARHCQAKGWTDTVFQFYLNNKIYYRQRYERSSAPWIFDEPVATQDFWALRWFGQLWYEAVKDYKKKVTLWYRADVSYTQFSRDILWGVTDIENLGGMNAQKARMKREELILGKSESFVEYGTMNKVQVSNVQPVLWCVAAWTRWASGVLPWQTIGSKKAWETAERTAIIYPSQKGPQPSLRLKALTVGQQLVEYLVLFAIVFDTDQLRMGPWLREQFKKPKGWLQTSYAGKKAPEEDSLVRVEEMHHFRKHLGSLLSGEVKKISQGQKQNRPIMDEAKASSGDGYVSVAPKVESKQPECRAWRP